MDEINCKECGLSCRIVYGVSRIISSAMCPSCQKKFRIPAGPVVGVNWINPDHERESGDEAAKRAKAAGQIRRLPK
jgi:hypothetical protein